MCENTQPPADVSTCQFLPIPVPLQRWRGAPGLRQEVASFGIFELQLSRGNGWKPSSQVAGVTRVQVKMLQVPDIRKMAQDTCSMISWGRGVDPETVPRLQSPLGSTGPENPSLIAR